MAPDVGLAEGTCTLWQEELLLDYTIEVEDEKFKVHKVTMASVSNHFKAMLTGGLAESQTDRVRLEGLSSLVVSNMIEFIYTGEFGCPKAGTEELLGAAVYLQIKSAIKACTDLLYDEVNVDNCLHILSTFKTYSVEDGIKRTTRYIQGNMDDILQTCEPDEMSCEKFVNLMECWGRSEWALVNTTIQWLNVDFNKRKEHINEVMSHIRFSLMSPTQIGKIKKMDIFCDDTGRSGDLMEKALRYHKLPMHQQVLDDTEQTQVRNEPVPVVFEVIECEVIGSDMYALHQGKSWKRYDTRNAHSQGLPSIVCPPTAVLEVNNFLILCDEEGREWHIFDPRTFSWSTMAPMSKENRDFGIVHHEKQLYVLGGLQDDDDDDAYISWTDVIEKYDFETNTWSVISSKLLNRLAKPGAFSIGGYIYVVLGRIDNEIPSQAVDCLDVNKDTWSRKAPLVAVAELHSTTHLVELHGEQVIAGLDVDFRLHYYKPSTDQWLIYNPSTPAALEWYSVNKVLARGNCFFLLDLISCTEEKRTRRACEKWTLADEGPSIDKCLDSLPVDQEDLDEDLEDDFFCALLSVGHCYAPK